MTDTTIPTKEYTTLEILLINFYLTAPEEFFTLPFTLLVPPRNIRILSLNGEKTTNKLISTKLFLDGYYVGKILNKRTNAEEEWLLSYNERTNEWRALLNLLGWNEMRQRNKNKEVTK